MGVCHTYGTVGQDSTHFAEIIAPSCNARRYRFALQRPADSPTGPRAASLASSSLPWKNSPLPEALLRQEYLAAGLVDVKVAAFSPTHTAVKLVIPVRDRR